MLKLSKLLKPLLPVLMLALVLAPSMTFAQIDDPSETDIPIEGEGLDEESIATLLERIANFLITIALIIVVIAIVWGGILWMTAGGDDSKAAKAKSTILNGIIGAAVIFFVGIILNTLQNTIADFF
jgi:hypothetical protein